MEISNNNFNDTNWIYGWFDNTIEEITSNLNTIKNEYSNHDPIKKIFDEYNDIIDFKIKQTYQTLMKLYILKIETPVNFYKKYYGPFKKEIGKGPFEEVKREVSYTLESFLTQLKSLIDISIKFGFLLATVNHSTNITTIDSLGLLENTQKRNHRMRDIWFIIGPSRYFSDFIKNKKSLFEVQNYRDIIIHEGYIPLKISASINEEEIFYRYTIPKVTGKRQRRKLSKTEFIDIIQHTREKFYLVLSIILKFTHKLFTKNIKKKHLKELLKFPHKDIAEILRLISVKGKMGENYFKNEEDLNNYLRKQDISPSELIEYKKSKHEYKSKSRSSKNTTEYIDYIPMSNFEVYRVISKHEMEEKIISESDSYLLRKNATQEIFEKIPNSDKIIENLKGCGLIYVINEDVNRFGTYENDLRTLIFHLLNINQQKWTTQLNIHKYEKYLPEIEEVRKRIHGEKHLEIQKSEDEGFERELGWHEQWKKDPYYDVKPQLIVDENNSTLSTIFPHDYLQEYKVNFVNWRKNNLLRANTGKIEQLMPPKPIVDLKNTIEELIKTCNKRWKTKPYDYMTMQIRYMKKDKKSYEKQIEETKKDYKPVLRKYSKFKPILKLINGDIYSNKVNYSIKHPGLFSSV